MSKFAEVLYDALTQHEQKVAIVDCGGMRKTTFAELKEKACRVAGFLQQQNIPEHSFICLSFPKDVDYFACEIGCWFAGHAVVPMGDKFPKQRVDYITSHCQSALILEASLLDAIAKAEPCQELVETDEEQLAAVYYTSGSTGNPKGVMHTFHSLQAGVERNRKLMEMTSEDIFSTGAPMYFMASIFDFTALLTGVTVHIYSDEVKTNIALMEEYIRQHGITTCFMSPTVVSQYTHPSPSLRIVLAASERLSGVAPADFRLYNAYGQTETAGIVTVFDVDQKYDNTPIGRVIDDIDYCILDEDGNPVEKGEEGELCLKGCLTPGYFQEERTARLWQNGWMHTGDLVRELPSASSEQVRGNLLYVNRKDWMVKINGQRVEPGEVEEVMKHCPGVKNAIVKGFENRQGKSYLCGFYIAEDDLKEKQITDYLRRYLPEYMIPKCMARMESFPLNQNGKLDRKSLQSPLEKAKEDGELTDTENKLKGIVAELLKTDDFSAKDNLGYIGLTSISSFKLASAVFKEFGVQLDVRALVKDSTVSSVAAEIDENKDSSTSSGQALATDYVSELTQASLTNAQKGVYVDCVNNPDNVQYNIPFAVKMPENITIEQLEAALRAFVQAHPFINCCFASDENGETIQKVRENVEVGILIKELTDEEFEQEKKVFVRPFDLATGPLYRFEIVNAADGLYLLVDIHHLIADGGSMDVFFSQLAKALGGYTLEKEHYDYYHFAQDQNICSLAEEETFFEQKMSQIEEASQLIPDVYKPEGGHRQKSIYVSANMKGVEQLSHQLGITPASVFLGAMALAVSKYVAEDTVGICTISNGRSNSRIAEDMGMFVNTLPLVIKTDGSMTVEDYLHETSENFSSTIEHENYPFARISEKYGFQGNILFAYQVDIFNEYFVGNDKLEIEPLEVDVAKFPVTVLIEGQTGSKAQIHIEYDTDLFSESIVQGFASSINNVVNELQIKEKLHEISLCDEQTLSVLDSFNNPVCLSEEEQQATVLSMFIKMATLHPDNIAVVFKDKKYTYRELDALTDKIGAKINSSIPPQRRTVGEAVVVSIIIHRNEWMVLASLAALKAGCAYQPLDPSYPQERLNFMIKDANAALLIADPDLRPIVNEYEGDVLLTSDLKETLKSQLPPPRAMSIARRITPGSQLKASSLLTLLYTSGSTGVPKGVMLEHQNLIAFNKFYKRYHDVTPDSKIAAYASFGFDANMQDIYCTLMNGATLHIIDDDIRLDLEALHQYFEHEGITNCFMTTQVGVQYLENYPTSSSLKHLSMGGEKLRAVKPEELSYKIHNGYGPSETTCGCAFFTVEHRESNIPIGTPTDTCSLYIVDKHGHRLPAGAPGELWISGPQVGRGYLNNPEKSSESFTTNPFGGGRVYHSGDIVRYRQDGNIEFVGRKDGQVKIRGFRVELKEVEAVIRDFQGIKDVTVQAFDDPNGGKYIAAYVVNPDANVDVDKLNNFILDQKPPYMVPAVTMQIPEIPLNVNQKVDKKALPKPEFQSFRSSKTQEAAPLNALETELKSIIASVVNTEDFGITDILGYVGLTSISSIKLATLIYKKFGVQVNAKTLAKTGTLQSIENEILQHWMQGGSNSPLTSHLSPLTSAGLSYSQLGVYTECMSNPDTVIYNIPSCITIPDGISVDELKAAVKTVVNAHPYINMHFQDADNGETIQCPLENVELDIPVKDLASKEFETEKQSFVRPFDLHKGPLYRFEIVKVINNSLPLQGKSDVDNIGVCETGERLHLLCDFHHLIFDGGSLDVFLNQLCKALDGGKIEPETYDYYQFVHNQNIAPETEQFFTEQLGQIEEASALIPDVYTPNLPHENGGLSFPTDFHTVDAWCKKISVSTAAAYLSATFIAVSKFTCEDTIGICTISNGRSNLSIAENFGMFVNTLPLVSKVDSAMPSSDFVKSIAKLFTDTVEHEDYPFARVASQFDYAANIMFAYQVGVLAQYRTRRGGLELTNMELDRAKFPVAVYINTVDNGAEIRVEYDKSMFSEPMMQGFGMAIENALKGLMNTNTVGDISITDESQWKVLDSYNAGAACAEPGRGIDANVDETVLSAFQKAARQYPDNIAAVFKDKKFTYRELDELTDKIGAKINSSLSPQERARGEAVVSILIPRNEYMFILPLAAMKAGCAYQPLDPSYPQERLNFMVKDANAALLIADPGLRGIINKYEGEVLLTSDLENTHDSRLMTHDSRLTTESLMILLYTSGSTGVPKGVMLEHRNVMAYVRWYQQNYELTSESVTAAYASFGFDANMMDMYPTLTVGATLCIIPEEIRLDLIALREFMNDNKVTVAFMTTQVAQQFALNVDGLTTLKHLSMGGEKMMSMNPIPGIHLHNLYGPTECSVAVTHYELTSYEKNIPIGRPTTTSTLKIVDKNGHRLPVGAPGELWINGLQVGRGYLNHPDKTAEAFVKNEGKRWYRTGDIVRYREDGNIEFVGRKDGQVKIRGFRIELKEVEAVIHDFPDIKNVTVQAFDYADGGKYIAAYIVSDKTIDVEALGNFIKSQKPPYMVPAVTMQILEIPLNANQKVDKKALPKPEVRKAGYVAPENDTEKTFCEVFEKVLGIEKVSATDDFFEIGGSSIIALKLVVAAEKAGFDIVYNDVFSNTTPRALAEFVNKNKSDVKLTARAMSSANKIEDGEERTYIGKDGYDYRPLNALLKQNTLDAFLGGKRQKVGDVLLTGATGFLGIHVLYDLITNYEGKIYCFVRPKGGVSGEKRLKMQLFYYFERSFNTLFGSRIFVTEGDATNEADMKNISCKVDTVVNCAACVKHFAKAGEIENVNVGSVRNIIAWCLDNDARLVHVSTGSIAGMSVGNFPPKDTILTENMFYFGQNLDNQYVHSKFMAERLILDSILHHGLNAKIMRVGNLSARNVDGEFQINFRSNNFMNTLRAFQFMGVIPYSVQNQPIEFSPIDDTAHTIMLLSQTPRECIVLHPLNVHKVLLGDVIRELSKYGSPIRMVEDKEYADTYQTLIDNPDNIEKLRSLMAYNSASRSQSVILGYDSSYTSQLLYRMDYCWPITTWDYVQRFIKCIGGMGMFES